MGIRIRATQAERGSPRRWLRVLSPLATFLGTWVGKVAAALSGTMAVIAVAGLFGYGPAAFPDRVSVDLPKQIFFCQVPAAAAPATAMATTGGLPHFCVDKSTANPGEILSYSLRVENTTGAPLAADQLVALKLDPHLVYQTGSARLWLANPGRQFSQPAGSRWTVDEGRHRISTPLGDGWTVDGSNFGRLQPGDVTTITFNARLFDDAKEGQVIESIGFVKSGETWLECVARTTVRQ